MPDSSSEVASSISEEPSLNFEVSPPDCVVDNGKFIGGMGFWRRRRLASMDKVDPGITQNDDLNNRELQFGDAKIPVSKRHGFGPLHCGEAATTSPTGSSLPDGGHGIDNGDDSVSVASFDSNDSDTWTGAQFTAWDRGDPDGRTSTRSVSPVLELGSSENSPVLQLNGRTLPSPSAASQKNENQNGFR